MEERRHCLIEVRLGVRYFEIAMRLREYLFANGLFNTEAWYDLKEVNYKDLEEADERESIGIVS